MLNIVHCVTDEKFAKNIVTTFDFLADRCHSSYVYIERSKPKKLRYIADNASIEHLNIGELMKRLHQGKYDVLFLHNLRSMPLEYIHQIPIHVKVVWLAWGFDIYSRVGAHPLVEIPYAYHAETKKLLKHTLKEKIQSVVKHCYKCCFLDRMMRKAVARADYFSGVIPEEYDMVCRNSFFRAQPLEYRYSSPLSNISLDLLETERPVRGMNIMVGNSGDPTNNHADIFMKLSKLDLGDRKILVPLSYAGSSHYIHRVETFGERLWGNRFVPIKSFMPFVKYKEVLSSCSFRIFGHERQQAMGNVRMAFREGCKVFLSETSVIYHNQAALGLKVYTIQNDINQEEMFALPTDEEVYNNRKITIEDGLTSKQVERLYNVIKLLNK